MNMPLIQLSMYEALTEAGVKPDAARKVEREFEAAIQVSQDAVRAEMREHLMTKADGADMKAELKADIASVREEISGLRSEMLKALNEQTWKLVSFVVVANGIMIALLKYLS